MPRRRRPATAKSAVLIVIAALLCGGLWACRIASAQSAKNTNRFPSSSQVTGPSAGHYVSALPRGTKLLLKDGSYELVREYEIQGNRVRYYSIDRSQWEVIPTVIVDWDATKKTETEEEKDQAALLTKVKKQEDEHDALPALDIDA
ncbi:MAG: hypothetical protein ACRD5K_17450, partial [Candidatus Acidiferrales bacterium]